jgi:hypothetical protein
MAEEGRSKSSSGIQIYWNHRWYLFKSGYLLLTWIMLVSCRIFFTISLNTGKSFYVMLKSFHLELIGPTMPILASNMQVTYSGMGTALASRSAGYLMGNLLGAILQTIVKNHSEALLFAAFILPAIGKTKVRYNSFFSLLFPSFSDISNSTYNILDNHVYSVFSSRTL